MKFDFVVCFLIRIVAVLVITGFAKTADIKSTHQYVYENYDLTTYMVPMRDGTRLFTQVYSPKDKKQSYPILLNRTPYRGLIHQGGVEGYFGNLGPGPNFIEEGYIFVVQDVRGRFFSEGEFKVMRPNVADWSESSQTDESTDAYDTIDWLVTNLSNHNEKVGVFGISYPGTYAALALVNAHPNLNAALIEAPVAETFMGDDYHHNGALQLLYPFMWLNNIGLEKRIKPQAELPGPIGCSNLKENYYSFFLKMGSVANMNKLCFKNKIEFWNDLMEHDTYDAFWQKRSLGPNLKNIKSTATLVVGSWFDDQDLYGTLDTYRAIEKQNPGISNNLVMGPWSHNKWYHEKTKPWGKAGIPANVSRQKIQREILLPFFNYHLKNKGDLNLAEATIYDTGKNQWKYSTKWPQTNAVVKELFLNDDGRLSLKRPARKTKPFDEFISDPNNPVPQIKASEIWGWSSEVMHYDQRFAAERDDVLTYQGNELESDLTVAGPIDVELFVSTTGTDADWIAKVIDVYPDGKNQLANYQMLVRGDIIRGKFRNSFEKPEAFIPNKVTRVKFTLPDVHHTFRQGHKVMIQVQSSWFPYFDRNPQKFMNINRALESDFGKAKHRVYHSAEYSSRVLFQVLD